MILKTKIHLLLALPLIALLVSCSKKENPPPNPGNTSPGGSRYTITSINPLAGPKETEVTITGTGFDPNSTNNTVSFNGVEAIVKSATATQLVVEVPSRAGDGAITININNETIEGPNFDYQETYWAGSYAGSLDGTGGFVDGVGLYIRLQYPTGLAIDTEGNVYVADSGNNLIRKLSLSVQSSTFAGISTGGASDGTGTAASFLGPAGLTRDASGNIYVADSRNHRIRKITTAGVVTTVAGSTAGYLDGTGTGAKFYYPSGITVDGSGNLFVVDRSNHCIRKITPAGVVTTFAGSNTQGYVNGTGTDARFTAPYGIAIDAVNNLFIADESNHCIRKITPLGIVTTVAGTNEIGNYNGTATSARFFYPTGIAVDAHNNLLVVDKGTSSVRKITPEGMVSSIVGNLSGFSLGYGTSSQFNYPIGIAIHPNGNFYVTERNRIRKITVE